MFLSFPAGTKMFQFPAFASGSRQMSGLQPDGFPHSDTAGSLPVCSSPTFFAAYHVLLRLRKPRHPPYALIDFLRLYYSSPPLSAAATREIVFADLFFFTSLSVPNIFKQLPLNQFRPFYPDQNFFKDFLSPRLRGRHPVTLNFF